VGRASTPEKEAERRRKCSENNAAKRPEVRAKISASRKGKPSYVRTLEINEKNRLAQLGKPKPKASEGQKVFYRTKVGLLKRKRQGYLLRGYLFGRVPRLLLRWRKLLWRLKEVWNNIFN